MYLVTGVIKAIPAYTGQMQLITAILVYTGKMQAILVYTDLQLLLLAYNWPWPYS